MKINELTLPKKQWVSADYGHEKEEIADELIDLVRGAYAKTLHGSFVNNYGDVARSNWLVIDWDEDPDIDAVVFYRPPGPNES